MLAMIEAPTLNAVRSLSSGGSSLSGSRTSFCQGLGFSWDFGLLGTRNRARTPQNPGTEVHVFMYVYVCVCVCVYVLYIYIYGTPPKIYQIQCY